MKHFISEGFAFECDDNDCHQCDYIEGICSLSQINNILGWEAKRRETNSIEYP